MSKAHAAAAGSPEELAAVRHLAELGYEDPLEAAARRLAVEQGLHEQFQLAEELLRAGQVGSAIDLLEEATRSGVEWTAGRHLLARAYVRAGRLDAAGEQLEWLEVHAVEHAELSLLRARIALTRRCFDAALDHAEYAKCLQHPLPDADLVIGEAYLRRGELDAAAAAMRRAAENVAQQAAALSGLAAIAMRRGQYEEAVDLALQALEHDFGRWQTHGLLGRALMRLGGSQEAVVALETCVRMNPPFRAPYRWLAHLWQLQGDIAKAASLAEQARQVASRRRQNLNPDADT